MACVKPNGELTSAAAAALMAARSPIAAEALAEALGRPLFQTRAIMREMGKHGFAEETDGLYTTTALGEERLRKTGRLP